MVSVQDVADFLGRDRTALNAAQTMVHVDTVTAMVRGYTRGRGFDPVTGEPAADLSLVIIASTARLMTNPEHTISEQILDYAIRRGVFAGWTLPELAVLHRYRRRAA